MHPYVKSLQKLFKDNADPEQAAPMKRYMRDQFDYLGIKSPKMGELLKGFIAVQGLPRLPPRRTRPRKRQSRNLRRVNHLNRRLLPTVEPK